MRWWDGKRVRLRLFPHFRAIGNRRQVSLTALAWWAVSFYVGMWCRVSLISWNDILTEESVNQERVWVWAAFNYQLETMPTPLTSRGESEPGSQKRMWYVARRSSSFSSWVGMQLTVIRNGEQKWKTRTVLSFRGVVDEDEICSFLAASYSVW